MLHPASRLRLTVVCAVLGIGILGGCATAHDPRDPLEPINRGIYKFNDAVDTMFLKPVAQVYEGVTSPAARTGVSNVFSNINDVVVALNNLLQGKVSEAASDIGRVLINTTAGLFGLFDVATPVGLEKHDEDFGQTLGYWGVGDGPYLVLPIIGPRTTRDTGGLVVDFLTDPVSYTDPSRDRNQVMGLRLVSRRAELLGASNLLSVAALDEYEFVRDAYLQRRRNLIHDGNPPREKEAGIDVKPLLALPAAEPEKTAEVTTEETPGAAADAPAEAEATKPDELSQSNAPAVAIVSVQSQPVVRIWLP